MSTKSVVAKLGLFNCFCAVVCIGEVFSLLVYFTSEII